MRCWFGGCGTAGSAHHWWRGEGRIFVSLRAGLFAFYRCKGAVTALVLEIEKRCGCQQMLFIATTGCSPAPAFSFGWLSVWVMNHDTLDPACGYDFFGVVKVLDHVAGGVAGTFCDCWKRVGLLLISSGVEAGLFADGFVLKGYAVALVCRLSVVYMYSGPLLMQLIFASQIFWLLQVLRLTIVAAFS
ncbi:hypothetical protein Nepgr_027253 [Nepenthes gracilis]|uniref:Uncharacterized protein n=1 Tax=Nepenthes gracilis TaxID=150966 RepID=A0AAD3Y2S6_NEPGR|nr:hypothetical protein Nepgr_027253 [Nepenthes gracilis]